MQLLVINCGSSSIKAEVVNPSTGVRRGIIRAERVGTDAACVHMGDDTVPCPGADHAAVLGLALPRLLDDDGVVLGGVGHRVVHGGARFTRPTRIDDAVEAEIDALASLAPLHNPPALAGIRAARALLPDVPHIAVFDTAFHGTLPRRARTYALPLELAQRHGIRRFGFHGTSHAFVARRAAEAMDADLRDLRVITCHLGNGCSVAAVEYGRSIETSMGMTPLEGLVMGTRSGDVDPGLLIHLARAEGWNLDDLDRCLNRESGLAGLSGVGNDMRDIEERAANGDERCRLAIHVFAHRLRKYVGAYAAVMGGVDAIVFTGGIGENSALIRHRVLQRMDFLGARLDDDRNRDAQADSEQPVIDIGSRNSRVKLLVVATDEALEIAREANRLVQEQDRVETQLTIPIAISARHVHLTQEAVEALFGPGHQLQSRKGISQPGQFACIERVDLVGPKRTIEGVRVIGPTRSRTQVEISRTDEFFLGIDAPVRASGDLDNTPGITLVGTAGSLLLEEGVICSWRHIHMHPDDAGNFGVKDKDVVEVAVDSDGRDLVFGDVLVRVSPKYALEMHLDTDEGNAADLARGAEGVLCETRGIAKLKLRVTRHDRDPIAT